VENFANRHDIPCAYFTGLQLGRVTSDLQDHLQRTLFQGKTATFKQAARLLSEYAADRQQPFVLIFEGLNEHSRISQFAGELEELIEAALKHPQIRFFLTCRSEYFTQRFGSLTRSSFKSDILLIEPRDQVFGDLARDQLLKGYFKFFEIDSDQVEEQAKDYLKNDTLLLRFFCEAYGARGRMAGYRMPYVPHIYRAQIFDLYLQRKLTAAADAKNRETPTPSVLGSDKELMAVVRETVAYMVKNRQFADVPFNAIPRPMHSDLYFLLSEEILLRRDPAASAVTSLGPTSDVLNFVYDEFRDFLIAKYLVENVYPSSVADFADFVARGQSGANQVSEGIKRFLFYTSRRADQPEFWKYYSQQAAYAEVYVPEIFFVDDADMNSDDVQRVRTILEAGGPMATRVARFLLSRGMRERFKLLNLELLLDVVGNGDDARHGNLVIDNFIPYYSYRETTRPSQEWADSFDEHAMPRLDPVRHQAYIQLMTVLFPLDRDGELESPTVRLFRRVAAKAPAAAFAALQRALEYKFTLHRPFVWRLLAEQHQTILDPEPLRAKAQAEMLNASKETATEIRRFLSRLPTPRP
jgi:hypothetical protein